MAHGLAFGVAYPWIGVMSSSVIWHLVWPMELVMMQLMDWRWVHEVMIGSGYGLTFGAAHPWIGVCKK